MPEHAEAVETAEQEVVAFRVSDQDFCCDIISVREIRGWSETTVLPHAQSYVRGVMNLRGTVVPVIDLSERLGLGRTETSQRHVIIIAVIEGQTVGLIADVVSDILTVADEALHPVPEMASTTTGRFLSGVVMLNDRMYRKIDLRRVLPALENQLA